VEIYSSLSEHGELEYVAMQTDVEELSDVERVCLEEFEDRCNNKKASHNTWKKNFTKLNNIVSLLSNVVTLMIYTLASYI